LLSHISHLLRYVSWAAAPGPSQGPSQQIRSIPSPPAAPDWANSRTLQNPGLGPPGPPKRPPGGRIRPFRPPLGVYSLETLKYPIRAFSSFLALEFAPKNPEKCLLGVLGPFTYVSSGTRKRGKSTKKSSNFHFFQVSWKKILARPLPRALLRQSLKASFRARSTRLPSIAHLSR
jgi:hypothetical protein